MIPDSYCKLFRFEMSFLKYNRAQRKLALRQALLFRDEKDLDCLSVL